jgi:hypothetical protein
MRVWVAIATLVSLALVPGPVRAALYEIVPERRDFALQLLRHIETILAEREKH